MNNETYSIAQSTALQRGDRVEVQGKGYGHLGYDGYVDDTMPHLNIVWVRELGTGERKMLSTDEFLVKRSQS
ncbi:MAG: hypothetical protein ACQEXN_15340 [Actinomycetota bacterium]